MNLIISRYIESSIHISGKERGGGGAGEIPRQWVSFMETKRANLIPTIGAKSDVIKRINEARSLVPPSFRVDGLRNNGPGALTIENNVQTPPCIPDIAGRYYARSFYSLSLVNVFRCARHFAGRGARGSEGRPPPPISRVPHDFRVLLHFPGRVVWGKCTWRTRTGAKGKLQRWATRKLALEQLPRAVDRFNWWLMRLLK